MTTFSSCMSGSESPLRLLYELHMYHALLSRVPRSSEATAYPTRRLAP